MKENYLKFLASIGYDVNGKISYEDFKKILFDEKLELYKNLELFKEPSGQAYTIYLYKSDNKFYVTSTGERGSGRTLDFESLEEALNYIVFSLRNSKEVSEDSYEHEKPL